jgi:prepilin-type processing-associated H-X9-DG protein
MDENLVGYLLKALDADEQHTVEKYLREHPEAEKRLEQLRRRLDLLARDAGDGDPPSGLWVRTLAKVAEHQCRTLPPAPATRSVPAPRSGWWRRADLLVAAAVLVVVSGLAVSWVARMRLISPRIECANNLKKFGEALNEYAETHNGLYPWVGAEPPKNFAGSFVPALNEAGVMPTRLSVNCPGNPPRPPSAITFDELKRLQEEKPEEFRSATRTLAGCYAYSLGYQDANGRGLFGLTKSMDGLLPIMADAPSCDGGNEVLPGNSVNHGGKGQNVLFLDGHVEFHTTRSLGPDEDDIYLNTERRVAAGHGPRDIVLGRSDAVPFPRMEE